MGIPEKNGWLVENTIVLDMDDDGGYPIFLGNLHRFGISHGAFLWATKISAIEPLRTSWSTELLPRARPELPPGAWPSLWMGILWRVDGYVPWYFTWSLRMGFFTIYRITFRNGLLLTVNRKPCVFLTIKYYTISVSCICFPFHQSKEDGYTIIPK